MLDQMLFKAQFTTGQTIRLNTADGVLLDSCDANIGVLQGKVRTVPAILCDGATADDQWKILNIVNGSGMFLDHVAIKGAVSDEQAHRLCQKYLTEARKGVVKNQIPVTDNGLKTFLDSATLPHKTAYFLGADAMLLDAQGTVSPVIWDENDQLVSHGGRLSQVMFDMAGCDIQGTLLEQVSPRDIIAMLVDEDSEGVMLDAMIIKYNKLEMVTQKLAEALKATDTEEFFVKSVTPIEPFKRQGVVNVGAIFEMSDSQTITVLFNNPDTTPAKLTGTDVLTSWKWILNKRDVTAILQPRAVDARKYPQIAARMFKVLAKNHDRFKRAQALKNKDELLLNELVGQVEAAQLELRTLQQQGIEIQQQIDGAMIRKQQETEALAMQQKDAVDPVSLEDEAKAGADKFHEGLKAALDQNQEAKTAVIAKLNEIVMRLINEHGFSKPEGSTQAEWHVELESDNGYDLEIATDEDEENPEIELSSMRLIVDTIDTTESVDYIVKAIAQRAFERDFDFSNEGEIEDETSPYLGKTGEYAFTVEQLKKAAVACGLDIVFADFNQTEATAGLFDSIDHKGELIYGITAQIGKDGNVLARASVDFDGNLDLLKGNSGSESIALLMTDQATQVNIAEILQKLIAEAAQAPELTGDEFGEQNVQMNNEQAELKKSVYAIKAANPRARKAAGTVTIQPVEGGLYEVLINLDGVGGQYAGDLEGTKAWLTHRMMGMGEAMGDKSYTFADMAVKLSLVIGADVLGIVASDNPYEKAGAIDLVKALIAELHANGWEKAGSTAVTEVQVKGQSDRLKLQFDPFRKGGEIALNNTADEDIQTFTLPEASEQGIKTKAKEIMLFVQGYATAAPVDEITDATQAGDYAKIMNDEAQLKEWQDPLDSFFQSRLIDTRNALRELGWTGERFKDLSKNGYTLKMDLMQVGGGGNVVGVTYSILDTEFRLRDDLSLAAQGLAGRIDSAVPAQTENEQNVQMNNEAPAGIVLKKEAEDAYRMLDHIILDFQSHTPSEFKNADVPGKFKPWIEKAEAVLQRKFRDEKYRAEIEASIKRANETIDRWNRVNAAEQPTEANQDQQFLNDVIAGNVDLLSEDTANRIEQIGDNLDPAHEDLFEQAIEAYSQAALKNAQTIA